MQAPTKPPSLNPSSAPFFPTAAPPPDSTPHSQRTSNRLSGSSIASFRSREDNNNDDQLSLSNLSIHSSPRVLPRSGSALKDAHTHTYREGERGYAAAGGLGQTQREGRMSAINLGDSGMGMGEYGTPMNGSSSSRQFTRLDTSMRSHSYNSNSNNNGHHSLPPSSVPSDVSSSSSPPPPFNDSGLTYPTTNTTHTHMRPSDPDFESRAKSSPFLNDILDRLVRSEYTSREIQRELGDVNRNLGLLLARTEAPPAPTSGSGFLHANGPPPGLTSSSAATPTTATDNRISAASTQGLATTDDVKQLSQRLNTLTTSVSQLLALQTKAHLQTVNASFSPQQHQQQQAPTPSPGGPAPITPRLGIIADTPPGAPPGLQSPAVLQSPGGLGFPGVRGSPARPPGPPRQWSQGSLDLSGLGRDPNLLRQEALLRDKRRPSTNLIRRESAPAVDTGDWGGGSPRESGPNITKWEQLPLSAELQHAIIKYGIGPPNKIQQRALPFLLRGSDIIAQAPPTQERIAAYVIPAIQECLNVLSKATSAPKGPLVVIICTTVDQANQGHKLLRDLGGPIGLRTAIGTGMGGDVGQELRSYHQNMPHVVCGTPQKLHALFTSHGGLSGGDVRFLVLDEVDQLIARNLHEFVFNIVRLLPNAARRGSIAGGGGAGTPAVSPGAPMTPVFNPFDGPFGASSSSPFQGPNRRFPPVLPSPAAETVPGVERQTALFSNTVPQDVLNLANAIQMREPVRVLVRRDGQGPNAEPSGGSGARGLKQFYLYLAFTAGGRAEAAPSTPGGGLGIIGSGRGATNPETEIAKQWKLDALADLFDDIEVPQAIVHVGGMTALENVLYKLASKGLEVVPLHGDMNQSARITALNKFRTMGAPRQSPTKILVVYDVPVKAPDVFQIPLIINYDLPKAVEEYAHRVASAISNNHSRAGVVVNFVTATGGDVEMLRSIECFYKIKCPEVPISLRDVL